MNISPASNSFSAITPKQRRAESVVGTVPVKTGQASRQSQDQIESSVLHGEVVEPDYSTLGLRVRGNIFEGRINRPDAAIDMYRLHAHISPSSVIAPGENFHTQA